MYFTEGAFWYLLVLCSGLIGYVFSTDTSFYKTVTKPDFSPKPQVFAIVWPILYVLQATSTLLYKRDGIEGDWSAGLTLFIVFTAVSTLFSPLFFKFRQVFLSWVVVVASFSLSVVVTVEYFLDSTTAGFLFIPTPIWLGFAVLLMSSIWYYDGVSEYRQKRGPRRFSSTNPSRDEIDIVLEAHN